MTVMAKRVFEEDQKLKRDSSVKSGLSDISGAGSMKETAVEDASEENGSSVQKSTAEPQNKRLKANTGLPAGDRNE